MRSFSEKEYNFGDILFISNWIVKDFLIRFSIFEKLKAQEAWSGLLKRFHRYETGHFAIHTTT